MLDLAIFAPNFSVLFLLLVAFLAIAGIVVLIVVATRNPDALKVLAIVGGVVLAIFVLGGLFLLPVASYRRAVHQRAQVGATRDAVRTRAERDSMDGRSADIADLAHETPPVGSARTMPGSLAGEQLPRQATNPPLPRRSWPREHYKYVVETPDDLTLWKETADQEVLKFDVLAGPKQDWGETWKQNAAGSERVEGELGHTLFVYWAPGRTGHVAAYSGIEVTAEEAEASALAIAREKLAVLALIDVLRDMPQLDARAVEPLVRTLATTSPRRPDTPPFLVTDGVHFERAEHRRTGGTVHRAAVRVRADDEHVGRLVASVRERIRRGWIEDQRNLKTWLVTGFSLLVLAFAVFLIYTFLNAGTKGHFAWPLRVASLLVFVLLCGVIFYVRSSVLSSTSRFSAERASGSAHLETDHRDEAEPTSTTVREVFHTTNG